MADVPYCPVYWWLMSHIALCIGGSPVIGTSMVPVVGHSAWTLDAQVSDVVLHRQPADDGQRFGGLYFVHPH